MQLERSEEVTGQLRTVFHAQKSYPRTKNQPEIPKNGTLKDDGNYLVQKCTELSQAELSQAELSQAEPNRAIRAEPS